MKRFNPFNAVDDTCVGNGGRVQSMNGREWEKMINIQVYACVRVCVYIYMYIFRNFDVARWYRETMNCSRCGGVDFSKALETVHRDIFTSRYHIEHARFPPPPGGWPITRWKNMVKQIWFWICSQTLQSITFHHSRPPSPLTNFNRRFPYRNAI